MLVRIHLSPGDEHDAAHGCRSMAALGAFVGAHLLMDRAYEGGGFHPPAGRIVRCVCSIESGPCERVESLQMSGRF